MMESISNPKHRELFLAPPRPNARDQPPPTESIERSQLLGEYDPVSLRHDDNRDSELHLACQRRNVRKCQKRLEDLVIRASGPLRQDHMIGGPD
jgi:hypothetical protein